jgi:hypothetical protein
LTDRDNRLADGVRQLDLFFLFGAEEEDSFQVLWEDGERLFCRGWRLRADGHRLAVLAVVPAVEHPPPDTLDRLAHEYGLKDELDGAWAVRPLELVRERGRTMLVLEDPGGELLEGLLGQPMAVEPFLHLATVWSRQSPGCISGGSSTRTSSRRTSWWIGQVAWFT